MLRTASMWAARHLTAWDLEKQRVWVSVPWAGHSHWLGACRPPCYGKFWQGPAEQQKLFQTKHRWELQLGNVYQTDRRRCCCYACRGSPPGPNSSQEDVGHMLLGQRKIRSPTAQDHQAGLNQHGLICTSLLHWHCPHRGGGAGSSRDSVSRGSEAEPRHRGDAPAPTPMPWLKCTSHWQSGQISWLRGTETKTQDCSLPHYPNNCSMNKWGKKRFKFLSMQTCTSGDNCI